MYKKKLIKKKVEDPLGNKVSVKKKLIKKKVEPVKKKLIKKKVEPVKKKLIKKKVEPVKKKLIKKKVEPVKKKVIKKKVVEPVKKKLIKKKVVKEEPKKKVVKKKVVKEEPKEQLKKLVNKYLDKVTSLNLIPKLKEEGQKEINKINKDYTFKIEVRKPKKGIRSMISVIVYDKDDKYGKNIVTSISTHGKEELFKKKPEEEPKPKKKVVKKKVVKEEPKQEFFKIINKYYGKLNNLERKVLNDEVEDTSNEYVRIFEDIEDIYKEDLQDFIKKYKIKIASENEFFFDRANIHNIVSYVNYKNADIEKMPNYKKLSKTNKLLDEKEKK